MIWKIRITELAAQSLKGITDVRVRQMLMARIDDLTKHPELQGKALTGELDGIRSVRAVGQRYRILFRLEDQVVTVIVLMVGIRKAGHKKDIYQLARKLLKARLV